MVVREVVVVDREVVEVVEDCVPEVVEPKGRPEAPMHTRCSKREAEEKIETQNDARLGTVKAQVFSCLQLALSPCSLGTGGCRRGGAGRGRFCDGWRGYVCVVAVVGVVGVIEVIFVRLGGGHGAAA